LLTTSNTAKILCKAVKLANMPIKEGSN